MGRDSLYLCEQAAERLAESSISAEVVDLRVVNPLNAEPIIESVGRTRRLLAVDGGWQTAGMAGEIIASVAESVVGGRLLASPVRLTLPAAPAPTSRVLEQRYYATVDDVVAAAERLARQRSC